MIWGTVLSVYIYTNLPTYLLPWKLRQKTKTVRERNKMKRCVEFATHVSSPRLLHVLDCPSSSVVPPRFVALLCPPVQNTAVYYKVQLWPLGSQALLARQQHLSRQTGKRLVGSRDYPRRPHRISGARWMAEDTSRSYPQTYGNFNKDAYRMKIQHATGIAATSVCSLITWKEKIIDNNN